VRQLLSVEVVSKHTREAHHGGIKDERNFQNDGDETSGFTRGFKLTAMCALKSSALFTVAPRLLEVYFSPSRLTRIEAGG
jgi:hypothetical protein